MAIELATFEQIARILSQLSTNYTNLFTDYYNIFYNNTPMDVTLQYYTQTGELRTVTLPNRAKDRKYILNGKGSPEGKVSGAAGVIYQDLTNGDLYVKQVSAPEMNGWERVLTTSDLINLISKGAGNPEGTIVREKGSLYVDTMTSSLYIKTTNTGNKGWLLVSANTSILAKTDLSNLTEEGEGHFANPDLSNLSDAGQAVIASKEIKANKVTSISDQSTDEQYPSAKAAYTAITQIGENAADRDLSNLTNAGEDKLIKRYSSGILDGADKVSVDANNLITLESGVTLILAAERNLNDKTANNVKKVLSTSKTVEISSVGYTNGIIYYEESTPALRVCNAEHFFVQDETPVDYVDGLWYSPSANVFSFYESGFGWINVLQGASIVGTFSIDEGRVKNLIPYQPFVVANADDVLRVENRIEQVKAEVEESIGNINDLINPILQVEDPTAPTPAYSLAANGLYIETTTSGDGRWSRVYYADNTKETKIWIEQGGIISTVSDQLFSLTFLEEFSDTNYYINKNFAANNLSSVGMAYLGFWDKTTTGATTRSMGSTYNQCWYACGR